MPGLNKIVYWLEEKTLKKRDKIDKYGVWGLLLFVAIPLPGTGGWTGALLASLLHLDKKKSFIPCAVKNSCIVWQISCIISS